VGLSHVVSLAAGDHDTCVSLADGTARCWGANSEGGLGDGTLTPQPAPDTVIGLTTAQALAAGGVHSCSLAVAGNVFCWGGNASGQIGDDTTTRRLTPVATETLRLIGRSIIPVPLSGATGVSDGGTHSCAAIVDGSVRCWGDNSAGQIGNGGSGSGQHVALAVPVPSFTLNLDPEAFLRRHRHAASVTVLATCAHGHRLKVTVRLLQHRATATGHGRFRCAGRLKHYPVRVIVRGHHRLVRGAATGRAKAAITDRGRVAERQRWTRTLTLSRRRR
jgi:hypothetical protein